MSLRRTALQRRTELRRTSLARRSTPRARAVRTQVAEARRNTGPDQATRTLLLDRAMGHCEMCGRRLWVWPRGWLGAHSVHHRQPRGIGGSSRAEINSPANLLLICGTGTTGCHGWVETNRAEAYTVGLLVRASADPAAVPVVLEGGVRYLLTHDGARIEVS